ncbi:MAG: glutamate formimidoyltransferase [Chloroflexota bacterium]|nr:glutamate formimidoyltransferase [Chloroflexota bacterium]
MASLVECVPNFSEGRRAEVVDALAEAVGTTPGVLLLDRTSDPDHNRSVLTFAGEADSVGRAMEAAVGVALARIDMERHEGQHPRIGAVDVIPFVPLGETRMEECVALARHFGARIAARFDLPVYLYAEAATRPERRVLPDIRKPQYEGLKTLIAQPAWEPDYGPAALHPRGGAVAVGARPFLIAYNVNLDSEDVGLAKRIANRIRERSGGLPRVQALGLFLDDLRCAQVSMNLLDFSVTPLWQLWETVGALAAAEGVNVRESELVGLAPVAALLEVAEHAGVAADGSLEEKITAAADWLRIRDFEPTRALELRLAEASGAVSGAAGGS